MLPAAARERGVGGGATLAGGVALGFGVVATRGGVGGGVVGAGDPVQAVAHAKTNASGVDRGSISWPGRLP